MNESKHFQCTVCGKCCYGQLPLTFKDAIRFSGIFPLCLVWTPVLDGSKDFKWVSQLGTILTQKDGKKLASLIVPTSFIPSTFPCAALVDQKFCSIHEDKPSRCKSMPFYPYRQERYQGEVIQPKPGWECDISPEAPIIFDGKKVLLRDDFDREKNDLLEQVPLMHRYAEYMFKHASWLPEQLWVAAIQGKGGQIVTSLSSFLTAIKYEGAAEVALKQFPVLLKYAAKTANDSALAVFHTYYRGWAKEMEYISQRPLQNR